MKTMNILVFSLLCCLSSKSVLSSSDHYNAIFNFGDSHSDTGNFLITGALAYPEIKNLPYGETFFHHATGRCSNGRLIIDFIAEAFGLPYLPPYLAVAEGQPVRTGVNFAVAGATAIDASFFSAQNFTLWTNDSLNVQLGWFKSLKSSLCTTKQECDEYFKKSLFLVGEIGENDYNFSFLFGRTIEQLRPLVPQIVGAIIRAVSVCHTNFDFSLVFHTKAIWTVFMNGAIALIWASSYPHIKDTLGHKDLWCSTSLA